MTLSEFKAWFEGFTEAMDGPPGLKAWERIHARVKEITGTPISYPVYVDRYVYPNRRFWGDYVTCRGIGVSGQAVGQISLGVRRAHPARQPDA